MEGSEGPAGVLITINQSLLGVGVLNHLEELFVEVGEDVEGDLVLLVLFLDLDQQLDRREGLLILQFELDQP